MLILSRNVGQTLVIGADVTVTVLGVYGNRVRIGVNTPKDVTVYPDEIYQRIQKNRSDQHPESSKQPGNTWII